MEEQINKKNIIFLFLTLIILFLFFYKGVILPGDEYLEEYNNFRNSTSKQNLSSLRKGNLNIGTNSGSTYTNLQKRLFEVLQNFEDMKLNFSSSLHSLKTNHNELEEGIEKLINVSLENFNITEINDKDSLQKQNALLVNTMKDILKEFKKTKYKNGINSFELLSDGLNSNVELLRNSIKEK
jgi:hypothetical protein